MLQANECVLQKEAWQAAYAHKFNKSVPANLTIFSSQLSCVDVNWEFYIVAMDSSLSLLLWEITE